MTTRPERSIAAARVKTAPVTPADTAKYQSPSVLAIGCGTIDGRTIASGAMGGGASGVDPGAGNCIPGNVQMYVTESNAQYIAGSKTRNPPTRA
jgi:hypothetical protein